MAQTLKQKEIHLNAIYNDCFSEGQAVDAFIYLTNKKRNGGTTTKANIIKAYYKRGFFTSQTGSHCI